MVAQNVLFRKADIPPALAEFFEPAECGACYVCHSIMVLREIRRVLRPDGVVWWNIGDGYAGSGQGFGDTKTTNKGHTGSRMKEKPIWPASSKPKDLILMPERVALAAQGDGWWVRSRIAWVKPNAMPESVRDRPTDAWEHIWVLTTNARHWYDPEAGGG